MANVAMMLIVLVFAEYLPKAWFQARPLERSLLFADMLQVIAMAAADHTITADEAGSIRARWEELKSVTEGFVRAAEEGKFGELGKHIETRGQPKH